MSRSHRLSPVDTAWLHLEERENPVDIAVLMTFDEKVDWERMRRVLEERLLGRRRFRQRAVESRTHLRRPRWREERPAPSIDAHFSRRVLPAPGGRAELEALVDSVMSEPIDMAHSPWRVIGVDGLAGGGSATIAQLHHCMGDGFALVSLLLSMVDSGAGPDARSARPATPMRQPGLAGALRETGRSVAALARVLALPFDPPTCLRGRLSGRRRAAWTDAIPLADVKAAAHAYEASVNDLLMAATAGALRRYLLAHDRAAPTIRAIVPVNLRPPGAPIGEEIGNRFGLIFVSLPVAIADPIARIELLERELGRQKMSAEAPLTLALLDAFGRTPGPVERAVADTLARKASVVVTNVPGPSQSLELAGSRIRDLMFWVPHPGRLGVGISILSYAGGVRIGVRADAALVPDPHALAGDLVEEIARFTRSASEFAGYPPSPSVPPAYR